MKAILKLLLVIFLVLLGITSFFVTDNFIKNRNNVDVGDSSVAGFGLGATRDYYERVGETFSKNSCESYLNYNSINTLKQENTEQYLLISSYFSTIEGVKEGSNSKSCTYFFKYLDEIVSIQFDVYTYNRNSLLDTFREDLWDRVNALNLGVELEKGEEPILNTRYFFGSDRFDINQCVGVIFHDQNEFEYAKLTYSGLGSCESVVNLNKIMFRHFSNLINYTILSVTSQNK